VWSDIVLVGSRVLLRQPTLSDVGALVEAANEDRSSYAYTWVPSDIDGMTDQVSELLRVHQRLECVPFVVVLAGEQRIVGATRFMDIDFLEDTHRSPDQIRDPLASPRAVEIGGTWYASSVQRTAVNTECKLLLLTHAFEQWRVERVCLKTDARNLRSREAIERIGATFEGVRRAHMRGSDGTIRDSAYYSVLAGEWPSIRQNLTSRLARSTR
jgi:RimJ/RimL family protein N-acetyltransferase